MSHILNNPIAHNDEITNDFNKIRNNKTYQDSNIFGNKSQNNNTLTSEARGEIIKENVIKQNPTFSSSIFSEKMSVEQKNSTTSNYNNPPHVQRLKAQDHSNEELFGNYKEKKDDFAKEEQPEFVPRFPQQTAADRKNIQVYGHELEKKPKEGFTYGKTNLGSDENPMERKLAEHTSNIFNLEVEEKQPTNYKKIDRPFDANVRWNDPSTEKMNRYDGPVDEKNYAYNRKIDEMNSQIFGENKVPVKENENKDFSENVNQEKRKKNQQFSDLFGIANYETQNNVPKYTMPSNAGWSQVDSFKQNPFKHDPNNKANENLNKKAFVHKQEDLKSTLDTHGFPSQERKVKENNNPNDENLEKKFVVDQSTKPKDLIKIQNESRIVPGHPMPSQEQQVEIKSEVYDFDIKGLDNFFEENKFKRFCSRNGYHLVEFQTKYNNIMNTIASDGRVKIRANDVADSKEITEKLKSMGLEVTPHEEKTAKPKTGNYLYMNNLDWKEGNLQIEERRLHNPDFGNAREAKMKDLESNGALFGNAEGVGQWDEDWKKNQQKELKKNQNDQGLGQEDVMKYGNWNKAMKKLDCKIKKFAPVLKNNSSKGSDQMKTFEPHSQRSKKSIK